MAHGALPEMSAVISMFYHARRVSMKDDEAYDDSNERGMGHWRRSKGLGEFTTAASIMFQVPLSSHVSTNAP